MTASELVEYVLCNSAAEFTICKKYWLQSCMFVCDPCLGRHSRGAEDFLSDANPKYSICEVTMVGCHGKDECEHAANPIALDFLKFRFIAALLFFQPRLKWGNETEAKNIASIMRKAWLIPVNIPFF